MMHDDRIDAALSALLAPPARTADEASVTRTQRLIALDARLAAARQAGLRRTALGIAGAFAAAGGLALFATAPAVGGLGGGALALMLLTLAAQSPGLTDDG